MKFTIHEEQGKLFEDVIATHRAANATLQAALDHHTVVMKENQATTDALWSVLEEELELDMKNNDWMFLRIKGIPYVVSQSRKDDSNG
jgi:hypothetical protein